MSEDEDKKPVVLKLLDYLPSKDKDMEEVYESSSPDLREIADRVYLREDLKEMFIEMYLSFEDLHDCSITDRGFNLYTEDDKYMYVFTVIKKEEIK